MDSLSVHYTVNKTVYEKKGEVEQVTNALPNVTNFYLIIFQAC